MITAGKNITSVSDPLVHIDVQYLVSAIKNPKEDVKTLVEQMRIIRSLSKERYNAVKRQLPYFVCANFIPLYRKIENFAYTRYFVIDIDHLSDKGMLIADLRQKIQSDSRVMLCFSSPSSDGLKVMLKLKEKCYDAGVYKLFYKLFVESFSKQYNLQQMVDSKTCDVSRACFISYDPEVYYNPSPETIDCDEFVSESNSQMNWDLLRQVKHADKEAQNQDPTTLKEKDDISVDTMDKLKELIGSVKQKVANKTPKYVYVPEILNDVVNDLCGFIKDSGLQLMESINIQYGKKLRFMYDGKEAETNLYYGKRGFSVVASPRTGTDKELNYLAATLIQTFVNTL